MDGGELRAGLRGGVLSVAGLDGDEHAGLPEPVRGALRFHPRTGQWQAAPYHLALLQGAFGARLRLEFDAAPPLPFAVSLDREPRPYQVEALAAWQDHGGRGVVVLPTGAGKTYLALMAIAAVRVRAVVLVPTLDLLGQWRRALRDGLGLGDDNVGVVGGGERDVRPLMVITYESAARHPRLMADFGLLIADEAHHLPSPAYRRIAEAAPAPYRLGLSATPERGDGLHHDLDQLLGPVVFRREPRDLAESGHIARFEERRIVVSLSEEEQERYDAATRVWQGYLRSRGLRLQSGEDFERLVLLRSGADPEAYAALRAHQEARRTAFGAGSKLEAVEEILARHHDERVLIFSEYNSAVEELGRRLCLPVIVHDTPGAERRIILERFRAGVYTKLATGRVLNEGVDVPDATVAVIISGSGVRREHVQRLGRILRPKAGRAVLYELVTKATNEAAVARRRREAPTARPAGDGQPRPSFSERVQMAGQPLSGVERGEGDER